MAVIIEMLPAADSYFLLRGVRGAGTRSARRNERCARRPDHTPPAHAGARKHAAQVKTLYICERCDMPARDAPLKRFTLIARPPLIQPTTR